MKKREEKKLMREDILTIMTHSRKFRNTDQREYNRIQLKIGQKIRKAKADHSTLLAGVIVTFTIQNGKESSLAFDCHRIESQ